MRKFLCSLILLFAFLSESNAFIMNQGKITSSFLIQMSGGGGAPLPATGAVSTIDFDESQGNVAVDSVTTKLTGHLFTDSAQSTMWSLTGGINNTSAVVVGHSGTSSGTISFDDDDRWSGHAGATGKQSIMYVLTPLILTPGTNYTFFSKGLAPAGQGEFSAGWDNACNGADIFSMTYYNTAFTKTCATAGTISVNVSTTVVTAYDATQGAGNKIKIYFGTVDRTGVGADNSITTTNGVSPFLIGRKETQANPSNAIIDHFIIVNYFASKETVSNYNGYITVIAKIKEDPAFKKWWASNGTNGVINLDAANEIIGKYDEAQITAKLIAKKLKSYGFVHVEIVP